MKGFCLTDGELAELREAHQEAKRTNANAAYKINAILLLGTGWKLKQVKTALLLGDETLRSYVEKYSKGGIKELITTNYKKHRETQRNTEKHRGSGLSLPHHHRASNCNSANVARKDLTLFYVSAR